MSDCLIRLENIRKDFGSKEVLKSINLDVHDKEFVTFLGPSGCGKTTTLRIIGGFETPDSGVVYFDGKAINDVPPHKRRVNTVFQRYALFTHLDVFENIAFGLRVNRKSNNLTEKEIEKRVLSMLELVNLEGYEKRTPTSLSGGEQQRVAIARALANHPQVLLLDEPLGALDLKLRKEMQRELKDIQQELGITFIYVTHDQEEALTMSDTIVVMNKGIIQQVGTPIGHLQRAGQRLCGRLHRREPTSCPASCHKDFDCSLRRQALSSAPTRALAKTKRWTWSSGQRISDWCPLRKT